MTETHKNHVEPRRFPRLRGDVWKNVPRLDITKIKNSRWVIDFFLAQASTQLVYGAAGTWKTTTMLSAGWAVSRGTPFLGRKTRQRCVLYLDFENPPDVIKRMCQDLKIDPADPAFSIWNRAGKPTPLPADKCVEEFVHHCKKVTGHSPWIIFDSWTSLLKAGDSGNQLGEATHIFRAIRHLCDIGATCTIIDHTGKSKRKDPIGTSAKMTQMDSSHFFEEQRAESTMLDSKSERTVVRVQSFLKRYAPKHVGTFSFAVESEEDEQRNWHVRTFEATKDRSLLKLEAEIEGMKLLIRSNPTLGKESLCNLADDKKIVSRDRARQLLQHGTGKHWESISRGRRKLTYRVLKSKL
jgi:RecA-family ATPase